MESQLMKSGGFTLIELTVVVAIIVALAAVVIPMVGTAKRDAQVAEILQVVDSLRTGCHRYYVDTTRPALEYGNSAVTAEHQLSLSQAGVIGWNGPYIDHSLSSGDNPYGGTVSVFDTLASTPAGGFDLVGAGSNTATGVGNFVRLGSVPTEIAQLVDQALDQGIPGNWYETGRVVYNSGTQDLDVFLLDTDGQ